MAPRPLIIGPWHSELGFEVLYWIPYLRRMLQGQPRDRIHVITRGGAGNLYGVPDSQVFDLTSHYTLEELRLQSHERHIRGRELKQTQITPWEYDAVARAARAWGLGSYTLLHPSLMYRSFRDVWRLTAPLSTVLELTEWSTIDRPPLPTGLPPRYYVAHFYSRYTLRGHPDIVRQINELVRGLASEETPVVCFRSPHHTDDHMDLPIAGPHIHTVETVPPDTTIAYAATVISHSQGFIGTYGGMQQMALRLGKPSLGITEHLNGTSVAHLYLSQWVAENTRVPFYVHRVSDLPWLTRLGPVTDLSYRLGSTASR